MISTLLEAAGGPLQVSGALYLSSSLLLGALSYVLWLPQSPRTLSSVSSTQRVCLALPVLPPCAVETLKRVNWGNLRAHFTCFLHLTDHILHCLMSSVLKTIVS